MKRSWKIKICLRYIKVQKAWHTKALDNCTSKFEVIGFTESLAYEVGGGSRCMQSALPVNIGTYRSMYSDEPVLKPEDVAMKILELCLPVTALPEAPHSRFAGV